MSKLKNCVKKCNNGLYAQMIAYKGELMSIEAFSKAIGKGQNTVRKFLKEHNPGYDPEEWKYSTGEEIEKEIIQNLGKGVCGKTCSDDARITIDIYHGKKQYCIPFKGRYRSPYELADLLHVHPHSIYETLDKTKVGDNEWSLKNGDEIFRYIEKHFRTNPKRRKLRIVAFARDYQKRISGNKLKIKKIVPPQKITTWRDDVKVTLKYVRTIKNHYEPEREMFLYQEYKNGKPGWLETFNYGQILEIVGSKNDGL